MFFIINIQFNFFMLILIHLITVNKKQNKNFNIVLFTFIVSKPKI